MLGKETSGGMAFMALSVVDQPFGSVVDFPVGIGQQSTSGTITAKSGGRWNAILRFRLFVRLSWNFCRCSKSEMITVLDRLGSKWCLGFVKGS